MKTNEITICALSIALGVIILAFGFQLTIGEYFWYFWATLMISLPGTKMGKACTFLATGLLCLAVCGQYLYLCSYLFWLGPYSLIWCLSESSGSKRVVILRYAVFLMGMLAVMWTTPMLFVQLGLMPLRIKVIGVIAAVLVGIPACFGYSVLYRNMRNLVKERVLR